MQNLPGRLVGAAGPLVLGDLKLIALAAVLGVSAEDLISGVATGQIKSVGDIPGYLEKELEHAVQDAEEAFGGPLWELLVRAPAGLDATAVETGQAAEAVKMVKRMLGFGLALPVLMAKVEAAIKAILGDHAPDGLLDSIRRLPEEIGVNFFIGTVLERIFETAVATPLEEAIAQQTRPARFDFRVIKALLTKHHIKPEEAKTYLQNIGYRDKDLELVLTLAEQFLSVADIQQLYLLGRVSLAEAKGMIAELGYSPADTDHLVELYLVKSETQGAQQLRATARGGYLQAKITETEYRQLLASVNTPERSIDLEVESANLEIGWGRKQLSITNIKQLHQLGHINDRQAERELELIGYTEPDALQLIDSWTVERKTSHPGLSVNRILGYQLGGVIDRTRSLELLLATGMKVDDASLLVANPGKLGGIFAHELTPATVLSALKEGVLSVEDATAKLHQLNVDPEEISLNVRLAIAKAVRGPKPKATHHVLSEAQVIEAFKQGLATASWTEQELVATGYTEADAMLLVAIEQTKLNGGQLPDGWVVLT